MNRQEQIDLINKDRADASHDRLLSNLLKVGSVGVLKAHVKHEKDKAYADGLQEGIVVQREVSASLAKQRFRELIQAMFRLKEKKFEDLDHKNHSYRTGREIGEIYGYNEVVRYMQNRIDKLLFLIDQE